MQLLNSSFLCDMCRHFQDFFFPHFTLIDAHLEQLKESVEDACHNRGSFTATVVKVQGCSFLSSLLTAVLSHHLAWVFTVSRSSGETGRLIKSSSSKSVSVCPGLVSWPHPDFCCLSS